MSPAEISRSSSLVVAGHGRRWVCPSRMTSAVAIRSAPFSAAAGTAAASVVTGGTSGSDGLSRSEAKRSTCTRREGTPNSSRLWRATARYGSGPQMYTSRPAYGRRIGISSAAVGGPCSASCQYRTCRRSGWRACRSRSSAAKMTEVRVPVGVDEGDLAVSLGQCRLEDGDDRCDTAAAGEQQQVAVERGRGEHPGRRQHLQDGAGHDAVADPVGRVSVREPA